MAAAPNARSAELIGLRDLRAADLDPILEEEEQLWRETLDWDFRASADLVRRFVNMQALNGYALWADGQAIGYTYFVLEEHKGLAGDLYIRRGFDSEANENRLLEAALTSMIESPYLRRIESQLMMMQSPFRLDLPRSEFLTVHPRNFMMKELRGAPALPPGHHTSGALIEPWSEALQDAAARLIVHAYEGHVDADINDQYRSFSGARRFLTNIVQYPGCGTFEQPASFVATRAGSHALAAICLSSLVANDVGHITQVCVAPDAQGSGLGYELMRRSLDALAARGCRRASLTVTSSNANAVALYERMGFRTVRQFAAYVWEGF
jgi:ribosomal protein S18 acetylase RimI-like enzyme